MRHLSIIFILSTFSVLNCYSQTNLDALRNDSSRLYVEYAAYSGYINDSIYNSLGKGELFLGNKGSVYIYQRQPVDTFLKRFGESIDDENIRKMVIDGIRERDLEKETSSVYAKYYSSPDYLSLKAYNNGNVWISDTAQFKFDPVDEFQMICGYKCQKAVGRNPGGDEVTAWFTEDIPILSGPSIVTGLPGLILAYQNPEKKSLFMAVSISSVNIPAKKFRKWLTGPIMDKSEYKEFSMGQSKKFQQFQRMAESEKQQNH